jgi:lipopolysaccharide export system permease protein
MLFDITLRRDLARNFGATVVVILTVVLTIMLIRTLGQAAVGRIAPQDVALLLGYVALGYLPLILSLSLFIAVVATLGRMYRDSEMAIWFSSGIGLSRFVRPVLRVSAPVLVVVGLLALIVWPWENERGVELKERFERRSDLSRVAPGQFQTSSDGKRVFFIERSSDDGQTGRNVFIVATETASESVTSARSGRIEVEDDGRYLVLDRGQRNEQNLKTGEKGLSRFETYRALAGERILSRSGDLPPKARPTLDLLRNPTPPNRGELVWRLGLLLGGANLVLLGIGLSVSNPRHPSNWNLLFALLSFVVYYNVINLTQASVASGKSGMGTALVVVHGGAFALALALLWWRDHTNSRPAWSLRRSRAAAAAT